MYLISHHTLSSEFLKKEWQKVHTFYPWALSVFFSMFGINEQRGELRTVVAMRNKEEGQLLLWLPTSEGLHGGSCMFKLSSLTRGAFILIDQSLEVPSLYREKAA